MRGAFLNTVKNVQSFVEYVQPEELYDIIKAFRKNCDHYPHHYIMHIIHAIEILGYEHPDNYIRAAYGGAYSLFCRGLHVNPETKDELKARMVESEDDKIRKDSQ